jgi:hypothetical protein
MSSPILALDPGTHRTAYVLWSDRILGHGIEQNENLVAMLAGDCRGRLVSPLLTSGSTQRPLLVVEMIEGRGMPVGHEVFETCRWIGRFVQAWLPGEHTYIFRRHVKLHLCGSVRAKDSNIRQALLDAVGPQGTKKDPGPTYGIRADEWAALGVAVTYAGQREVAA